MLYTHTTFSEYNRTKVPADYVTAQSSKIYQIPQPSLRTSGLYCQVPESVVTPCAV